jgi:hypothetical protein
VVVYKHFPYVCNVFYHQCYVADCRLGGRIRSPCGRVEGNESPAFLQASRLLLLYLQLTFEYLRLLMITGRGTRAISIAGNRWEKPHVYFHVTQQPWLSKVRLVFLTSILS